MSKKIQLEAYSSNNVNYGRAAGVSDLRKLEDFAHEHTNLFTKDILSQVSRSTTGFDYSVQPGSNSRQIVISAGRAYSTDGKQYDALTSMTLTFEASETDGKNRIDLIIAVLDTEAPAVNATIPFRQIRSQAELENATTQYIPTQFNVPTERHNKATVQIKKGVASITPVAPSLASNEVLLYFVNVPNSSVSVRQEDIVEARPVFNDQRLQDEYIAQLRRDYAALLLRISRLENIQILPIDLGPVFGKIQSLADILRQFYFQINSLSQSNPEILRLGMALTNPNNGKLAAAGGTDNGKPTVNIELGARVRFASGEFAISPTSFEDQTRNPRLVQIDPTTSSDNFETALQLSNILEVDSDGQAGYVKRNATFATARSNSASCSRGAATGQGQFVEIFGGRAVDGGALGDWYSYDVVNDILTQRTFTGSIPPNTANPTLYPYGNGTMLLCCPHASTTAARWFRVDAVSGASIELTGLMPTGTHFYGDKITLNKIFIVAMTLSGGVYSQAFWVYDTDTHSFISINPNGNVPICKPDLSHGCFYQPGHFVLLAYDNVSDTPGKTYIFEYASLTFRELNFHSPSHITANYTPGVASQFAIRFFRLVNVAGRIFMGGGAVRNSIEPYATDSVTWELQVADYTSANSTLQSGWRHYALGNVQTLSNPAFCSTYTPVFRSVRQAPFVDRAVLAGGYSKYGTPTSDIFTSTLGGLVSTTYGGVTGITLAETATFAEFVLPVHTTNWEVAEYFASLTGQYSDGQVKLEVSFDDGATKHEVTPETALLIADSLAPGKRHLHITLYSYHYETGEQTGGTRPILTKIREIFDETGNLGARTALRYDLVANESPKAVYMDSTGKIILSTVIEPSTPTKCLLQKFVPGSGVVAPEVINYVNRRNARIRKRGTYVASDPATRQFYNDLAVIPRWFEPSGIKAADKHFYEIAEPTVAFDSVVTVTGVTTDGDGWEVELEG
ncbi:MAG TPA: hypothetical protein VF648_07090 [Pyrinomonadaceae bacterium]|jgi:hypothetical protein